jgi:putative ABC transport system substrate-binding protein
MPKYRNLVVLIALVVALATCGVVADAQQSKKVFRIGSLSVLEASGESTRAEAIRLALREIGYVEGQNIATEYRYGRGNASGSLSLRPSW